MLAVWCAAETQCFPVYTMLDIAISVHDIYSVLKTAHTDSIVTVVSESF